jgi:hypothetical protein
MALRGLFVSAEFLVELLKMREDRPRIYTVIGALPDDTRLVTASSTETAEVLLALESAAWKDEGNPMLKPPIVRVHVLSDAQIAALARGAVD